MSIYVAPRSVPVEVKAGPIGPGAGVLQSEFPLSSLFGNTPQKRMAKAYKIGVEVPWVRKAEDVIASRFSTVDWDLDDPEDNEINETYPVQAAIAPWQLLRKPQANIDVGQRLTRTQLWRLTSRHMGLCGNSFWFKDQPEALAGTPLALLYVRPDRMTANEDAQGNLRSWYIDKTPTSPGTEVSLEQVLHFMLEPPDAGHFGTGLVETWLLRAQITGALDKHLAQILAAGGRLSGILSPKQGSLDPGGDQALQLERDWRTITETPNAAQRLQVVFAPVDFTKTTLTIAELQMVETMKLMRDDGLAFWGVPQSIASVPSPAGLNSGDTRKYDDAALWQGSVHNRLVVLVEQLQDNLLDHYQPILGWAPQLVLDEPEFDDDSPRYDLLGKSINVALRNAERRSLIGLPPLGIPEYDDAVYLPMTMVPAFTAPENGPQATATTQALGRSSETQTSEAALAAGETTEGKATALDSSLRKLRSSIQMRVTPALRSAVARVLSEQKRDIAARIRSNAAHIKGNPRDTSIWFDAKRWNKDMHAALAPRLSLMAETVSGHIGSALSPQKAGPVGAVERALIRGGARVTRINETTRDRIAELIASGIDAGEDVLAMADALDSEAIFDEYRAELIARTELMDAYNGAALGAYGDAGVSEVQAIDGDEDPECAERDGQTFSVEEADSIEDHPNGTLDWVPVIGEKASLSVPKVVAEDWRDSYIKLLEGERKAEPFVISPALTVNMPAQAAPVMNAELTLPEQPAPIVNVEAPIVNVDGPQIDVHVPEQRAIRKRVERNAQGQVEYITESPDGE